jgi:hypothetical protein
MTRGVDVQRQSIAPIARLGDPAVTSFVLHAPPAKAITERK